jgi:hypothetical protein
LALVLATGCKNIAKWRDQQIAESARVAQGSKITPPARPPVIPSDVRDALPLDPSFTILSYADNAGAVHVLALSAWETTQTAQWVSAWLQQQGYDSEDNPSQILSGMTFTKTGARYESVKATVTLNTADQCTVELTAQ